MDKGNTEAETFSELRKSKRIDCFTKIQCIKSMHKGDTVEYIEPFEMTLLNVSTEGLGIISDKHFEIDTVLVMNIRLEEVLYQKVSAKVMWSIKKGDAYRLGLEIVNISGRLYRHLGRLDNSIATRI